MRVAEILRLIDESTKSVTPDSDLARDLGIDLHTLHGWRNDVVVAVPTRDVLARVARIASLPYWTVLEAVLRDTGHIDADQLTITARPKARLEHIADKYGDRFQRTRDLIQNVVTQADPFGPNLNLRHLAHQVASVENPEVGLHIGWDVIDPRPHGSFPDHSEPRLVIFMLMPFNQTSKVDKYPPRWWPVTDGELEDWVNVALGDQWFDFCYRVVTGAGLVRNKPTWYCVFTARDSQPFLAPDDFQWDVAGSGGPANRQKLRPRVKNRGLEQTLMTIGDVTSTTPKSV